ncbi:MAG: DUF2849 domain-containing protein [Caulobacteraceae bacterium]|nr:DUF2849 domain-containing protein [Caulobacter sp.]
MSRPAAAAAQAVTANRLDTGEVVFRRGAAWAARLGEADVYPTAEAAEAAVQAARAEPVVVVDPYRIELRIEDGLPVPQSYRERVRALGPTVHPSMGKQAQGGALVEALRAASGVGRSTGRLGLIARKR